MHFKRHFRIFYTVKIRNISLSEELKTVEEGNTEDNMCARIGLLPIFGRHYDTYCYSGRYAGVPFAPEEVYSNYKTNVVIKCPPDKVDTLTVKTDE